MRFPHLPLFARLRGGRRLLGFLCPALLSLATGCAEFHGAAEPVAGSIIRASAQVPDELPRVLPPVTAIQQPLEQPAPPPPPAKEAPAAMQFGHSVPEPTKQVPINLDTVLRLAESQNGNTVIALLKLQEAFANCDAAAKSWIPDLWVGTGWYRHDGATSNPDGTFLNASYGSMFAGAELSGRFDLREAVYRRVSAERQVWQQKAEVANLSTEALLEASTTYVDLLAARAAETVAMVMELNLRQLLNQANAVAKTLPAAEMEIARIQAELHGQQQVVRRFREGYASAGSKLIYHLGLDPASDLVIMDRNLVAFNLVSVDVPAEDLVAQAEHNGPGLRELENLLHVIQDANVRANGLARLMPVFDMRMAEGGFGTGPGDHMDWDSRWDMGIQMRWNLTDWVTRNDRQRANNARACQAQATYIELRSKLTMGVQEAREAIVSSRDQMDLGLKQVKHATEAYQQSRQRMTEATNGNDRNPNDVLQAIRVLNTANLTYLAAIRDHDKAQLRLAILTGTVGGKGCN